MNQVVLVTGASRGLGKAIYDHLSSQPDYQVYGTSRKPMDPKLLPLDVRSQGSIEGCIEAVVEKEGHIDVLINNVGSNLIGSLEGTELSDFRQQMEINYFGTLAMMKAVLPCFRQQDYGRIINISSIGAQIPLMYNSGYSASKAALEAMTESFANELVNNKIKVSLIAPIGLAIESEAPNLMYTAQEIAMHKASKQMYGRMMTSVKPSVTKKQVARVVAQAIKSKNPRFIYRVGLGSTSLIILKCLLPRRVFKWLLRKQLIE